MEQQIKFNRYDKNKCNLIKDKIKFKKIKFNNKLKLNKFNLIN